MKNTTPAGEIRQNNMVKKLKLQKKEFPSRTQQERSL